MSLPALKENHEILAHLIASGYTNKQCAQLLHDKGTPLGVEYISKLRHTPAIAERARSLLAQHIDGTMEAVVHKLFREAGNTLERMLELRDQTDDQNVAARISEKLFERQMEMAGMGRKDVGGDKPTIHITINSAQKETFDTVMAEVADQYPELTRPRSVTEVLEELPPESPAYIVTAGT